jgi:hypothetical protein
LPVHLLQIITDKRMPYYARNELRVTTGKLWIRTCP